MSCDQQKRKAEPPKFSKWSIIYHNLRNIVLHKRFLNSCIKSIWFRAVVVNQWAAMLTDKEIQIYNASNQRGRSDAAHCTLCALFTWLGRLGELSPIPRTPTPRQRPSALTTPDKQNLLPYLPLPLQRVFKAHRSVTVLLIFPEALIVGMSYLFIVSFPACSCKLPIQLCFTWMEYTL